MIPRTKVFVGSLPPATKPEEVRRLFENYGVVTECDVMNRCAFVHMQNQDMAESAIQALHNTTFKGVTIVVERGRVRERPPGGVGGMDSARGRVGAGPMRGSRGGMRSQPYGGSYGAARAAPGGVGGGGGGAVAGYGPRASYGTGSRYEGGSYRNDVGYSSSSSAYGYGYTSNGGGGGGGGGGYGSTRHSSSEDRRGFTLPSYPADQSRAAYGSSYDGYSGYDSYSSGYGYDTSQASTSYQRWPSSSTSAADSYSYGGGYSQAPVDGGAAGPSTDYSQSYPAMGGGSSGYRSPAANAAVPPYRSSESGYGPPPPSSGRRF
ncbi:heterogeneous nuclear ribonucleoprotein A3 homolog 2-like isoform X2 [Anopheles albimanus]|uniref:heterogeneous nuclear ribonucleoprotein A3 homolog 2-like isoform X2 n=1 Tax=Anopheles albimanus TaxID=7167 RepID=UPI001640173D|nr:heterogeneous nuclear ribonucleoprotein A3 homolog 2-like isoform X2 [Anopheles albimanus]